MKTVTVDADALRQVLQALNGPGHLISELQVTRAMHQKGLIDDNPIEVLIAQYNAAAQSCAAKEQQT